MQRIYDCEIFFHELYFRGLVLINDGIITFILKPDFVQGNCSSWIKHVYWAWGNGNCYGVFERKASLFRGRKWRQSQSLSRPNFFDTKQKPHVYGNAEKSEVADTVLREEGNISKNQWQQVLRKVQKNFERSGFVIGNWAPVWSLQCLRFKVWASECCCSLSVGTGSVTLLYTKNCFHVIWRNIVLWRFLYPQLNLSDFGPTVQHVKMSPTLTHKGKMSDHIKEHLINKWG